MSYEFFNQTGGTGNDWIYGDANLFSYPFTANVWFYPTAASFGSLAIISLGNTSNSDRFALSANTNTSRFLFNAVVGTAANAVTTANYTLNDWNMGTAVGVSSTNRIAYINAGNSGSNSTSRVVTTPNKWVVGGVWDNLNSVVSPIFEGRIAEVAVWNVELSIDEITSLYRGAKANTIRPQSLRLYVPLIRDISDLTASTTYRDSNFPDGGVMEHLRRYG